MATTTMLGTGALVKTRLKTTSCTQNGGCASAAHRFNARLSYVQYRHW
jgi:hypothetical protein